LKNKESILKSLLDHLINDSKKGTVSLLSGPWGCGKTYLWLHDVQPKLEEHSTITLSLFGLESVTALKTQLMNQCLFLKVKALKDGNMERALAGVWSILAETGKKVAKGVDSLMRTNLLSGNIDPMQFVDENLSICFDDVERISSKVGIDEVLGLSNYLAEHKHCRVLLIMDEDRLKDANSEKMMTYKERVIDCYLKVETDLESAFDLFINNYSDKGAIYTFLTSNKYLILQPMITAQCQNLRTLNKSIEAVAEIASFEEIRFDPALIPSLIAFQIEMSEGKLEPTDFYNFNVMSMMILSDLAGKKIEDPRKDQKDFINKYFRTKHDYRFVRAFYNRIKYGYFERAELKCEIDPEPVPIDLLSSALSATQSDEWWYLSDKEYEKWIKQIENHLFSNDTISTAKLIRVLVYLKITSDRCGVPMRSETDERIRERLSNNASLGDESFSDEQSLFLSEAKTIWEPYLHGYDEKARAAVIASLTPTIVQSIHKQDLNNLSSQICQKPKVLAAISEQSLQALQTIFSTNRLFFHRAVSLISDELLSYQRSNIIQNVDEEIARLRRFIQDLSSSGDAGKSDRLRLKMLIDKFPSSEQAFPESEK